MALIKDKIKEEDNVKKAYQYFADKGLPAHLAAGIIGNLQQESFLHLDSTVENSIGAVGIAQWLGVRRDNLEKFAEKNGSDYKDFDTQLDFLWKELNTTGDSWNKTKHKDAFFNAETAEEAAGIFVSHFERSGEKAGEKGYDRRIKYANNIYEKFTGDEKKSNVGNGTRDERLDGLAVEESTSVDTPEIQGLDLDNQNDRLLQKVSDWQDQQDAKDKYSQAQASLQQKKNQKNFLQEMIANSGIQHIERTKRPSYLEQGVPEFQDGATYGRDPREDTIKKKDGTRVAIPTMRDDLMQVEDLPEVVLTHDKSDYQDRMDAEAQATMEDLDKKMSSAREGRTVVDERDLVRQPKRVLNKVEQALIEKELPIGANIDINDYKTEGDIRELQNMLKAEGYSLGNYGENRDGVDGKIGSRTRSALQRYKKENTTKRFINEVVSEEARRYDLEKRAEEGKLSTQEQEKVTRTQRPKEAGQFRDFLDFVEGNYSEHITQPIKNLANNILPDPLNSDPSLRTSNKYDNTEGVRPLLIEDMSIGEIRKEKNISYAQISRNGRLANEIVPEKLKERLLNSIYPQGYGVDLDDSKEGLGKFEMLNRFQDEASKEGQVKRLPGVKGDNREDIFRMYAGLPQKHNTFTASSFKAGAESDTNVTFSKPEDVADYAFIAATTTDLFKKLNSGEITPESIKVENESSKKGGDKMHKASFRDPKNVMWNATFGVGFDGSGQPYLSFYDKWDLAGKDDNPITSSMFGAPIEIYDRIPLTDKMIKKLSSMSYTVGNDGESDGISEDKIESFLKDAKKDKDFKDTYEEVLSIIKNRY